jgi:hypothetical protein
MGDRREGAFSSRVPGSFVMGFRQNAIAAGQNILELIGDPATFQPITGDAVSLYVNVVQGVNMQPDALQADVYALETSVEYLFSDLGREVNEGETFTVDGKVYTVQSIDENDGIWVKAVVWKPREPLLDQNGDPLLDEHGNPIYD